MSQDAPLRLVGLPPSSGPLNRCVRLRVCVWWLTAAVCSVTAAGCSDCHGGRPVRMRGESGTLSLYRHQPSRSLPCLLLVSRQTGASGCAVGPGRPAEGKT